MVAAAFPEKFRVTDDTNPACAALPLVFLVYSQSLSHSAPFYTIFSSWYL